MADKLPSHKVGRGLQEQGIMDLTRGYFCAYFAHSWWLWHSRMANMVIT